LQNLNPFAVQSKIQNPKSKIRFAFFLVASWIMGAVFRSE